MHDLDNRTHPIREDMAFQRHWWLAERIGWTGMALLVVAALLGLFSSGPISHATARSRNNLVSVEYERFAHKAARTWLTVRVAPPGTQEVLVRISPGFARAYDIESLQPNPIRSSAGAYGLEFSFRPSAAGDLIVHIAARAKRFGLIPLDVEVEGRGVAKLVQLVYP